MNVHSATVTILDQVLSSAKEYESGPPIVQHFKPEVRGVYAMRGRILLTTTVLAHAFSTVCNIRSMPPIPCRRVQCVQESVGPTAFLLPTDCYHARACSCCVSGKDQVHVTVKTLRLTRRSHRDSPLYIVGRVLCGRSAILLGVVARGGGGGRGGGSRPHSPQRHKIAIPSSFEANNVRGQLQLDPCFCIRL